MSKNSDLEDCPCCDSDCAGTWRLEPTPCSCPPGASWPLTGYGCRNALAESTSVETTYEIWANGVRQEWGGIWGPNPTWNCHEFEISVVDVMGIPVELRVIWQYEDGCVHVETASLILGEPL